MSTINKILNPSTNRFVNIGSQKHKRLILEGVLPPVDGLELETEPMPEAVRTVKEPEQELTQAQRKDFKKKLFKPKTPPPSSSDDSSDSDSDSDSD